MTVSGRAGLAVLLLTMCLVGAVFQPFGRAETPGSPDLAYTMTVNSAAASKHIVHISISIPNAYSSSLTLGPHPFFFADEVSAAMSTRILNLTATDEKGEMLPTHKSGASSWAISPKTAGQVEVDYEIAMNITEPTGSGGYLNYLGEEFGLSVAAWVFLVPLNLGVHSISIRFSLPDGWSSHAPWDSSATGYISDSLAYFATSTFAVGRFELFSRVIGNTNVSIAAYAGWPEQTRNEMAAYSFGAFEYIANVFRASVVPRHLCIFVPRISNEQNLAMEWSQSQGVFVYSNDPMSAIVGFSHRIFHIYNAFPPAGMRIKGESEEWTKEGINTYYQMDKCLRTIGLLKQHEILLDDYRTYQTSYLGTSNDRPVAAAETEDLIKNWDVHYFIVFRKASLVSFTLDETISKLTADESLDDVLAYMYQKYGCSKSPRPYWPFGIYSNAGYSNEDLLHALNLVTGYDFKPFFQKYVYGGDKLPLRIVSGDLDVDWPELLQTMKLTSVIFTTTAATVSVIPTTETSTSETSTLQTPLQTTSSLEGTTTRTTSAQLTMGAFTTEVLAIAGLAITVLAVVGVFYLRKRGK